MKTFVFMALLTIMGTGCHSKVKGQKESKATSAQQDTTRPRVSWKVNRQLDSKGNLVRYDSTYTWSYSNNGKQGSVSVDSVMRDLHNRFNAQFQAAYEQNFGDPAWNDSLYYR